MNSENKAKIREALRGCQKFISSLNTGGEDEWLKAKEALAILAAEDKPSVPREMVRQLVVCEMDSHPLRECWSWPKALKIVESFGFQVKE